MKEHGIMTDATEGPVSQSRFGVGARALRVEDHALITGRGRYIADLAPDCDGRSCFEAVVVRANDAPGTFRISGLEDARSAPGVHLVCTADDVAELGNLPCAGWPPGVDASEVDPPPFALLCKNYVRYVGDAIAFIVADTRREAEDAAENLLVEVDGTPGVVDVKDAISDDAPRVWSDRQNNVLYDTSYGDDQAVEAAISGSAHVINLEMRNNRLICNYMDTRGAIGSWDPGTNRYTLYAGTQGGHGMRDLIAKNVLSIDPANLRVVTPDVGGGFGTKAFVYREYPLLLFASKQLGGPVRWICSRSEHFLACSHGRDHATRLTLALDEDLKFTALRVNILANLGAYLSQFSAFIPHLAAAMAPGCYHIDQLSVRVRAVLTNTVPVDAYRGAGRPEAAFAIERLVDYAARELGVDADDLRSKNFIRPDQMPYRTTVGQNYDTGEFDGAMREALAGADASGFDERLRLSRSRGRIRGLGFSSYIEVCAMGGGESPEIRLREDGSFLILVGTQTNGQGHATAYSQLAANHLGVELSAIEVIQGDTDLVRTGGGTGGSRSIPVGGVAVERAAIALAKQVRQAAADCLEADFTDITLGNGHATIVGTDRKISLADLAKDPKSGTLHAEASYKPDGATYPNGTHVVEVEIDPRTGKTTILRYTVVDDFGVTVNPMLLEGQVHGGIVQSIGQAIMEKAVYDTNSGQLISGTLLDYCLPRADDVVSFDFQTRNVPCKNNPLGIKGAGEAGTIGATPAVMNAVVDALDRAYGIRHIEMPATPYAVWSAIQKAGSDPGQLRS